MMGALCLHCEAKPAVDESKFCSKACRDAFAMNMAEAITCANVGCDAQEDGVITAMAAGWLDIQPDPEGTSWNYLGICPECATMDGNYHHRREDAAFLAQHPELVKPDVTVPARSK